NPHGLGGLLRGRRNRRALGVKSLSVGALAVLGVALFLAGAAPSLQSQATPAPTSEIILTLDPAQSKVHWTVDSTLHAVHGTFAVKTEPYISIQKPGRLAARLWSPQGAVKVGMVHAMRGCTRRFWRRQNIPTWSSVRGKWRAKWGSLGHRT